MQCLLMMESVISNCEMTQNMKGDDALNPFPHSSTTITKYVDKLIDEQSVVNNCEQHQQINKCPSTSKKSILTINNEM